MRLFARLSLDSALPDRTTIMNFRHLLELHQLARQLFKTINRWLAEAGVMMAQGTLVDATIIEAPSFTKNKQQQRDPEMHQTKKGNQWHFGMKAHKFRREGPSTTCGCCSLRQLFWPPSFSGGLPGGKSKGNRSLEIPHYSMKIASNEFI